MKPILIWVLLLPALLAVCAVGRAGSGRAADDVSSVKGAADRKSGKKTSTSKKPKKKSTSKKAAGGRELKSKTNAKGKPRAKAESDAGAEGAEEEKDGDAFVVYDAVQYPTERKPFQKGMKPLYMVYGREVFTSEKAAEQDRAIEKRVRRVAARVARFRQPVCVDIEHWPLDARHHSEESVRGGMERALEVIRWMKDEAPELSVGWFNVPRGDPNISVYFNSLEQPEHAWYKANAAKLKADYDAYVEANRFLDPLVQECDVLYPEVYAYTPKREDWVLFAKGVEQTIRGIDEWDDKPLVPVLCPRNFLTGVDPPPWMDGEYWALQLKTMRQLKVDGVAVWDSSFWDQWRAPDKTAGWWKENEKFLKRLKARQEAGEDDGAEFFE